MHIIKQERLVELENEEILERKENDQEIIDMDENNDDENDQDDDISKVSAMGLLSQILVMFTSLDIKQFIQIVSENAFDNVLASLTNAQHIS